MVLPLPGRIRRRLEVAARLRDGAVQDSARLQLCPLCRALAAALVGEWVVCVGRAGWVVRGRSGSAAAGCANLEKRSSWLGVGRQLVRSNAGVANVVFRV